MLLGKKRALLSRLGSLRHLVGVSVDSDRPRAGLLRAAGKDSPTMQASTKQQVEEIFRRCEPRLGRFLAQFVSDRQLAEDLLQDAFHDALRSGKQLAEARDPEAWLFGLARHRALAALRRRRRFDAAVVRLASRSRTESEESEVVALRDLLERTLDAEDRSLVLLRYLHEFEAVELAEMTGLTAEAVRQRLARARKRLLAAATAPDERTTEGEKR